MAPTNQANGRIIPSTVAVSKRTMTKRATLSTQDHVSLCNRILALPSELRQHIIRSMAARRLPTLFARMPTFVNGAARLAVRALLPAELLVMDKEAEYAIAEVARVKIHTDRLTTIVLHGIFPNLNSAALTSLEIGVAFPGPQATLHAIASRIADAGIAYPRLRVLHVALKRRYLLGGDGNGEQPDAGDDLDEFCGGVIASVLRVDVREKYIMVSYADSYLSCLVYMDERLLVKEMACLGEGEMEGTDELERLGVVLAEHSDEWIPVGNLRYGKI
ncbi:uncharacterized protein RCC_08814 [Ramularia collo-cygni]|uniref:Uncharacterized protein n=1 Tax=Ramularia collo-cygni TaxID=112498 RepID=A0A2D3VKX5_9PEZI|nr:uncharacterized protein RCC_08814 [Ramularia collo-cygni]CZT23104.1 uncharacterized protein RCC_08814 [Ramularia collo-cygni]